MTNNGLLPSCWGPAMWHSLASIAFTYKPNEKTMLDYYDFFSNLGNILPCEKCSIHYKENFIKLEDSLKISLRQNALAPNGLFKWVYDLHNLVNKQLNKPNGPTYDEVVKKYENYRANCSSTPGTCGTIEEISNKRIRIIEEFTGELTIEKIVIIVLSVIIFILIIYSIFSSIYYNRKKK